MASASDSTMPPVVATDLCRERVAGYTCDGRRPIGAYGALEFPGVDFSAVVADADPLYGVAGRSEDVPLGCAESHAGCPLVRARAEEFVEFIAERPAAERRIAVVSHKHFLDELQLLFGLRGEGSGLGGEEGEGEGSFGNAEMREVRLCEHGSAEL